MRQRKNVQGRGTRTNRAGSIFVPARPSHLKAKRPPPERDEKVPDRVWNLPLALEAASIKHKFFSKDLQKAAGIDQGTVSRWVNYQGLGGVPAASIIAAEEGLKLPPGTLLPAGITMSDLSVHRLAELTGLGVDRVMELQSPEVGERMNTLAEEVRRAVFGVSSVYGITLERGVVLAKRLVQKHRFSAAKSRELGAPFWFDQLHQAMKTTSDESGTHPSVGKIAAAKKAR